MMAVIEEKDCYQPCFILNLQSVSYTLLSNGRAFVQADNKVIASPGKKCFSLFIRFDLKYYYLSSSFSPPCLCKAGLE